MTARKTKKKVGVFQCRGYITGRYVRRAPCTNGLPLRITQADKMILAALEAQVLSPGIVAGAITKAIRKLSASVDVEQREALAANLRRVDVELARLTQAVVNGASVPSIIGALHEAEGRKARITDQLSAVDRAASLRKVNVKALEPVLRERLAQWGGLLTRHPAITRQIVTKLIGPQRLVLVPTPATKSYSFSGFAHLGQVIEGIIPDAETDLLVASSQGLAR